MICFLDPRDDRLGDGCFCGLDFDWNAIARKRYRPCRRICDFALGHEPGIGADEVKVRRILYRDLECWFGASEVIRNFQGGVSVNGEQEGRGIDTREIETVVDAMAVWILRL